MKRILALAWLLAAAALHAAPAGFIFEVQLANPRGGTAALYYDIGNWYSGRDACFLSIEPSSALRAYRFAIPPEPIRRLRFDVTFEPGTVRIGRLRLLRADGTVLDEFGPEALKPMHHIVAMRVDGGVATVEAGPDNPMLLVDRALQQETEQALSRGTIGPPTIFLLSLLVFGAIVFSVATACATATPPGGGGSVPWVARPGFVAAGAFLAVFGCRLAWLKVYSRPMPYWDEWEMSGLNLLMPLRGHFLDWQALFMPHSEHRTLVSRIIVLAGALLNGEWDPRVGMVAGAAMQAGSIAVVCGMIAGTGRRLGWLAAAAVITVACYPFDGHNLLCGDQCQMYALNLTAIVVLALSVAAPTPVVLAASGAASLISLFTMGSGFVAPLLASGICLVRGFATGEGKKRRIVLASVFFLAGLLGALLYRSAPFQGPNYTHRFGEFLDAFVARTSWPLRPGVGSAAMVWIPWAIFAVRLPFRGRKNSPFDGFLFALGLWTIADLAGLAYGRPFDPFPFDDKYYTSMMLTVICAILALLRLGSDRKTALVGALGLAVFIPVGVAVWSLLSESPGRVHADREQEVAYDNAVRPYLRTGDRSLLYDTTVPLPYWNGTELESQLDSPLMQPWLPAVLRECLVERSGTTLSGAQSPGPLTMLFRDLMKAGIALACLGAAGIVVASVASYTTRVGPGRIGRSL